MNKQDRQGVRTASDLERKYQFGKRFSEIMGIAEDAQKSVSEVESSLTDKINKQYSSFTRTAEEIQLEVGKVSEATKSLQDSTDELSKETNSIREEVSSLSVRSDEIAASVSAVTETTETLKTDTGELQSQTKTLEEEMSSLKTASDSITTEVSRVTTITEGLQGAVEDLENQVQGIVDDDLVNIRTTIVDQRTSILQECGDIVLSATKDTVTKEGLNEYKETLKSEFITADSGLLGRVEAAEKSIQDTNGKLEEELKKLSKYFSFTINGLEIGATYMEDGVEKKSPNKVVIDNDDITIFVGEKEVVTFKADGTGVVPDFKATRSADILGLRITQDSTHINCDYVGEVI